MFRKTFVALIVAALFVPASARAADPDGWPDTPAGAMARQWVAAFSTGETAMREFNARNLASESLARKGLEERVIGYRKLREKYGKLMLGSVVKSQPHELTVKLVAADASQQGWVFTVQKKAPHKLVSVAIQQRHGGHFGGFHH